MFRLISAVFVIIFLIGMLHNSNGYKWIALKSGVPIPENAIKLSPGYGNMYVGRAKHYNLVLPAEVSSKGAVIFYLSQEEQKSEYEVLVATENCEWKDGKTENIVRAGTAWNGEPIFIGRTDDGLYRITSVLLTSNQIISRTVYSGLQYLICDDNNRWVDSSSANIPPNSVRGGEAFDNNEMFVGRLLGPSSFVPGQVKPAFGIASATYEGYDMQSLYCQVLVGDDNEYEWKHGELGSIPDYAVVGGMYKNKELMYVARNVFYRTLTFVVFSKAFADKSEYDILVKVVK